MSYLYRAPSLDGLAPIPVGGVEDAGGKGNGLLRVPPAWYPPTVFLSPMLHMRSSNGVGIDELLSGVDQLGLLEHVLSVFASAGQGSQVIVRSNAIGEDMFHRGTYESVACDATLAPVLSSIQDIWEHASVNGHDEDFIGIILQPLIDKKLFGHLSNEWRVSRDSTAWLSETSIGQSSQQRHWRVTGAEPANDGELVCSTTSSLEAKLREVARRLSDLPYRHHLEWVWSGERLWIVQADRVAPTLGPAPGDGWVPTVGRPLSGLRLWKDIASIGADDQLNSWNKIQALLEFSAADLPVPSVWALTSGPLIGELLSNRVPEALARDIELLCSGQIIIRTDVKSQTAQFMLPKSEALSDPVKAASFLIATATDLVANGVEVDDICFLAHRFLRARGCAWARADPGKAVVQVDSSWGLADGLSWLPHDEAYVNVKSGDIRRSTAGKTTFVDVATNGGSECREAPTEWIWRSSMTEDQLRIVALGTSRLADQAARSIATMWFIGMQDGAETDCLPWFQTFEVLEMQSESPGSTKAAGQRVIVRTIDDLASIPRTSQFTVVRLQPSGELIRNREFLDRVVETFRGRSTIIEIVGSTLGHPYYLLRKHGLSVRCVGRFEPQPNELNKLVRDEIPGIIGAAGEAVVSYRTSGREMDRLLRTKIVEEAIELLQAPEDDLVDEMADVAEALDAFRRHRRVRRDDVRTRQSVKRTERGGFRTGQVIVSTRLGGTEQTEDQLAFPGLEFANHAPSLRVQSRKGGQLILSLIPPTHHEPKLHVAELGERSVMVEYRGSKVLISERPFDSEVSSQGQLF